MNHDSAQGHAEPRTTLFLWVWCWLLALTAIEVYLGYRQFEVKLMLTMLMSISVIKAGLIIAYFMHLRFEKIRLVMTLIPALVIVICLFSVFFPDSFRLMTHGWNR